jgi:hypothetical protein
VTGWISSVEVGFQPTTESRHHEQAYVVPLRQPEGQDLLNTVMREGAQRLIVEALQVEFEEFLSQFVGQRPGTNAGRSCVMAFSRSASCRPQCRSRNRCSVVPSTSYSSARSAKTRWRR